MSIDWLDPEASLPSARTSGDTRNGMIAKASSQAEIAHNQQAVDREQLQTPASGYPRFRPQTESPGNSTDHIPNSRSLGWYAQGPTYHTTSNLAVAHRAVQRQPDVDSVARQDETTARLFDEMSRTREEMQAIRRLLEQQTLRAQALPGGNRWWRFWR